MGFRLLGPVQAVAGDAAAELGGRMQRTLLALLLLEPGRPVPTDRLVDELWHGDPPARAEATLRSYVSRLRRAGVHVDGGRGGYAVDAERGAIDACAFEQLAREGREALARGAAGLAAERLRAALALWRGDAFGDVAHEGALAAEALRLEELRLVCVEDRLDADLALGRHAELVPELQSLVVAEPLRERLRRQLVLALYRAGRQSDALAAYQDARRVLDETLGLEPSPELKDLERAILQHAVAPVEPGHAQHNLPEPATSFVGRDEELVAVAVLLREHRLVTLTGIGGSGKTRLAIETARRQVDAWADGVRLVDLTALADPSLVAGAVASAVAADSLPDDVRTKELLIVLDNCEHVVDACAELAVELLDAAPNLRILATSRIPLGVSAERDFALDPLGQEAAVQLFRDRASAVRRDLEPDDAAIGDICTELDRLPLAIELAAARAKALSPAEIAARLDDRLKFLRAWRRVADPRHRTIETTMDWSYDLLPPEEQQLLRRLAVFAGGMTLDAVADVCLDGDADAALDLVARLVDASLVRVQPGRPTRYSLLETVRQYAAAKLAADPDEAGVHRAHAEHFLRVAETANLSIDTLGRGPQRPEIVLRDQHNIRAALDWLVDADPETGLRLMVTVENFWVTQALAEAIRRYEQLLARATTDNLRLLASATRDYAAFHDVTGQIEKARTAYERSRELFEQVDDPIGVANLDFRLGIVAYLAGDTRRARALWEQCLATFVELDDTIGRIQAQGNLGAWELDHGDFQRGRAMVENTLDLAREVGWHWWEARSWGDLAERLVIAGELDDAEAYGRRYLEYAWGTANRQETLLGLAILARAASARGDADRALTLWSSVEAVEDGPSRFGHFDRAEYARAMPDRPCPEPLPLDDAVALALS